MKILVTGGAGFIGGHLVEALLARGDEVVVLDSLEAGRWPNLPSPAEEDRLTVLQGDIRSESDVDQAFGAGELDGVLHQAALPSVARSVEDPVATLETNVTGTARVLEAARRRGVRRFVFASSSSVYGDTETLPKVETMSPRPRSPYAVSKLAGEQLVCSYRDLHGMATVALRYFNIFGARQDPDSPYAAVIPRFVAALEAGKPPVIFGDGEQTRDFTHVANAVQANLKALEAPEEAWGRAFNVGCGERISVNRLASLLRDLVGGPEPVHEQARPGDVRDSQASIEAAREQTRDFTHVANAVQANLKALEAPEEAWGRAFNVGCGERISVNRLASLLRDLVGGPEPVHEQARPGDVRDSQASIEAARELLGYEPEVDLEDGLRRVVG